MYNEAAPIEILIDRCILTTTYKCRLLEVGRGFVPAACVVAVKNFLPRTNGVFIYMEEISKIVFAICRLRDGAYKSVALMPSQKEELIREVKRFVLAIAPDKLVCFHEQAKMRSVDGFAFAECQLCGEASYRTVEEMEPTSYATSFYV